MEPFLFRHGKEIDREPVRLEVVVASMEPCLFRHGKQAVRPLSNTAGLGFNGAMSFQTW